jgi:hypothetical protein
VSADVHAPAGDVDAYRLRRRLMSPPGRAVMRALAGNLGAPLTARVLAELSGVGPRSARTIGVRAAALGYATQTMTARNVMAWHITPAGHDFTLHSIGERTP